MTERTPPTLTTWGRLIAVAVALLGTALGGCARDEYYCDQTGCYYCDGAGCRTANPPMRASCQGIWECQANQVCTSVGCVTTCTSNMDCPNGWTCQGTTGGDAGVRNGQCLRPGETPPTTTPGTCRSNAECMGGTVCIDGQCARTTTPACTSNAQCASGQVCLSGRCTAETSTCQFNNQCGAGRICVNMECRASCDSTRPCPSGLECSASTGGYCRTPTAASCTSNAMCGAGRVCLNGTCYQSCTPMSSSCGSAELYCSDDGVCVPDTRSRPFCSSDAQCTAGSSCVFGQCRRPCSSDMQCLTVDTVNYRNCGPIPGSTSTQTYCLTDNEARPQCSRQDMCTAGLNCIDGRCR